MSMKQAFNWQSQQRVDLPHLLMLENSIIFDGKTLMQMQQGQVAYILTGFDIATPWSFGQPANSLQVVVQNSAVTLTQDPNGSFLTIPSGTPNSQLNSANTQVTGSFTPSSTNYVAVQFTRLPDPATADLVAFWDEDASTEFTETVPLGLVLNFQFNINTSGFANNAPICEVVTDAFNNIISITNCKQGLYRLGSGGATPDANNQFPPLVTENPLTATSSAIDPFQGGDWALATMKNWMDEVMTQIKQIKGSAFWYSAGSSVIPGGGGLNLVDLFFDTDSSVLTSAGSFTHNANVAGQLSWNEPFYIKSIIGNLYFTVPVQTVQLAPEQVAYITLQRELLAQSGATFTFTNGSTLVTCSVPITDANLTAYPNTWIKTISGDQTEWVQVDGEVTPSSLTFNLTAAYAGPTVIDKAIVSLASYSVNVSDPVDVPPSGNSYWIAKRDDNWPSSPSWPLSLTTLAQTGGVVTAQTGVDHNLSVGQVIVIAGVADSTYDGTFEITSVPTLASFTYDQTTIDPTSTGGTVTPGAVIYLRTFKTLTQGASIAVDGIDTNNIIQYIGSKGESDNSPTYSAAFPSDPTPNNIVTDGNNLTQAIKQLDTYAGGAAIESNQDRTLKLIEGGTWAFGTSVLSWSSPAYIQIPGQSDSLNTIAAGSVTFTANDQVAYVEINRSGTPPITLTPVVAAIGSVSLDNNTVIIARYFSGPPEYAIVGNNSFTLEDGQASIIEGAIPLIMDFFGELRLSVPTPNSTRVLLSNSDVVMPTGEERSQRISSFLLNFGGAQIDFQTGDIYESDGSTPLGVDFSPVIPAAGMFQWFSITVIPNSVGSDNRMTGQILVLPAASSGSSAAVAPRAIFAGGSGVGIGQVVITSADGVNVTAITQEDIVQLGVGSGSGSGSGLIKVDLYDIIDTSLPSSSPATIDGVTVATGDTVLFSQLGSGNNEVYQATVVGGSSSPNLPNPIVLQISNANPYLGGNMESVTGGVATPQSANDAYFEINGETSGSLGTPEIIGHYGQVGAQHYLAATTDFMSQPFIASSSGALGSATIRPAWYDSTAGSGLLNVSIFTDNSGVPGTLVSNVATIDTSTLAVSPSSGYVPAAITVPFTSGTVTSGTTYHLVIDPTNVTFPSLNSLQIEMESISEVNADVLTSINSGASWTAQTGYNMNFLVTTGSSLMALNVPGTSVSSTASIGSSLNVIAQPFTPTVSATVAAIQYTMAQGTGPLTGTFTVGLYNDNAGQPGTLIVNETINISTIPSNTGSDTDYQLTEFTSGSLVSGTQYWILWNFGGISGLGGSGLIYLGTNGCASSQPPSLSFSSNGGSSYTVDSSTSAIFAVFAGGVGSGLAASYNNFTISNPYIGTNYANQQPFVAAVSGSLAQAGIDPYITNGSTYTGYLTVAVYTDNAGTPGTLVSNLAQISASDIPTVPGTLQFTSFSSGSIVSGTTYHLVTDFTNLILASGTYGVNIAAGTSSLIYGHAMFSLTNGSDNFPFTLENAGNPENLHFEVDVTSSTPIIFAQNTSINTTEEETTNTTSLGQTFTASGTGFLTDAIFQLSVANASPPNSGNLYVKLYTDNAGQPDTLIETSSALNSATLTTTPTLYTFTFSGVNTLTNGDLYHAILDDSALSGTSVPGTITWTPQPVFSTPYVPENGDEVIILYGIAFANQTAEFNGTTWEVNPVYRSFNGADFWEISSIISSTLINNSSTTIFSVTALGSENMVIDFSINRGGVKETGTAWLTNNGTVATVTAGGTYTGATGTTFSADISSGNVQLMGILDNSGGNATFKYTLKRWSDGTTGPTGIPSYAPVLPTTTSAFTMSDGSSTPYNCSAPFNVTGLTNITLDFSYMVGLNSGTTVGALSIYVNGQRISRYVSSAITPSSAGTLYTEISSNQIQFNTNIMSTPLSVEIILES